MHSDKETYEKQDPAKSILNTLQIALAKSKKIYKCQKDKLEQLTSKSNEPRPKNKSEKKPISITFKKSNSQQNSGHSYGKI